MDFFKCVAIICPKLAVTYILSLARQYRKLLTEHTGVAVVVNGKNKSFIRTNYESAFPVDDIDGYSVCWCLMKIKLFTAIHIPSCSKRKQK